MWLRIDLLLHVHTSYGPEVAKAFCTLLIVPAAVFDPGIEQHKFVEESREENKNTISTRDSMHLTFFKSKAWSLYTMYSAEKLFIVLRGTLMLACLLLVWNVM